MSYCETCGAHVLLLQPHPQEDMREERYIDSMPTAQGDLIIIKGMYARLTEFQADALRNGDVPLYKFHECKNNITKSVWRARQN